MNKFTALLRGINVSGQKIIRMADLRICFEALGFRNVKTYLQSGNVIFETGEENPIDITSVIQGKILDEFGFQVDTMVLSCNEIHMIAGSNPFLPDPKKEIKFLHVTIPYQPVSQRAFQKLDLPFQKGEEAKLVGQAIYLFCPNGYGRSKINNRYFEKALGFPTTTRNWKTTVALKELCNSSPPEGTQ